MNNDSILNRSKDLINKYNPLLAPYGICVTVKRRYHEEDVMPYQENHSGGIINILEYYLVSRRREKKYGKIPNRYCYLILQIHPLKQNTTSNSDCKQYAFLLKKTTRAHQGQEPTETLVQDQRLLERMEKRLQKLLKSVKRNPEKSWCKNHFTDALRYTFTPLYNYLERYLGKKKAFWDMFLSITFVVLLVLIIVGLYIIFN